MKRIVFIISILFCFVAKQKAQNLIQNGSFENVLNVDCYGGFYNGTLPNAHVLDYWYQFQSPDYFNPSCRPGGYSSPDSWFGYCPAKHGNSYIGIGMFIGNYETKEYAYQQLLNPLIGGKIYCLSFYVSKADRFTHAIKNIGALFTVNLPDYTNLYISDTPQVLNQNGYITDTTQWVLIQGCFTASGGEQYMTIGNFNSNANTDTIFCGSNNILFGSGNDAYYYIDDITLIDQSTVGFKELNDGNSFKIYPNPTNSILTITDKNQQLQNATVEIINTLGQLVYLDIYASQINISDLPSGIYFITINNKETKRTIKFVKG